MKSFGIADNEILCVLYHEISGIFFSVGTNRTCIQPIYLRWVSSERT